MLVRYASDDARRPRAPGEDVGSGQSVSGRPPRLRFGGSSGGLKAPVVAMRAPGRFGGCKSTCQFFWTKASLGSLSPATGDIPRLLRGALGSFWGSTFRELIAGAPEGGKIGAPRAVHFQ